MLRTYRAFTNWIRAANTTVRTTDVTWTTFKHSRNVIWENIFWKRLVDFHWYPMSHSPCLNISHVTYGIPFKLFFLYKCRNFTFVADGFASQTAIHAFRIRGITGHYAIKSFFHTNITTSSIEVVITGQRDWKFGQNR